jgi:hypothetical protein
MTSVKITNVTEKLFLLILLGRLSLFLPDTNQPLVHSLLAQLVVSLLRLHLVGDGDNLCRRSWLHDWQDRARKLGHARQLLGRSVSSLHECIDRKISNKIECKL